MAGRTQNLGLGPAMGAQGGYDALRQIVLDKRAEQTAARQEALAQEELAASRQRRQFETADRAAAAQTAAGNQQWYEQAMAIIDADPELTPRQKFEARVGLKLGKLPKWMDEGIQKHKLEIAPSGEAYDPYDPKNAGRNFAAPPKPVTPNLHVAPDGTVIDMNDPSNLGKKFVAPRQASTENEPLIAVMDPATGKPVLRRRSQAEGMAPASGREQGRAVTSGDAGRLADFDTSLDDIATLRSTLTETDDATGTLAKAGALLPNAVTEFTGIGVDAKRRQAVIDRVKQVIGKALEGGVLRKEDEVKYEKILPTLADTPEVAAAKLNGLERAIKQRRSVFLDALTSAGFETGAFPKEHKAAPPANETPEQRAQRLINQFGGRRR